MDLTSFQLNLPCISHLSKYMLTISDPTQKSRRFPRLLSFPNPNYHWHQSLLVLSSSSRAPSTVRRITNALLCSSICLTCNPTQRVPMLLFQPPLAICQSLQLSSPHANVITLCSWLECISGTHCFHVLMLPPSPAPISLFPSTPQLHCNTQNLSLFLASTVCSLRTSHRPTALPT